MNMKTLSFIFIIIWFLWLNHFAIHPLFVIVIIFTVLKNISNTVVNILEYTFKKTYPWHINQTIMKVSYAITVLIFISAHFQAHLQSFILISKPNLLDLEF